MNPILKNIIAVIAGIIGGGIVNMGLVQLGGVVFPAPEGADITSHEGLKVTMHLLEGKHFVFPFLAHTLGTLAGAIIAAKIAVSHKMKFALGIGVLFLIGGIANVMMLPSPVWFNVLDLVVAYIPAGYMGGRIAAGKR